MTNKIPNKYVELTLKSWDDTIKLSKNLTNFVFRGHADSCWNLSSTLEREAARFGCPPQEIWRSERAILTKFKSRAHHFLNHPPNDSDLIEWLSIIQDYGGPTRLLDFTNSFYLATFFAVESTDKDACVWAINSDKLLYYSLFHSHMVQDIGIVRNKRYDYTAKEICKYAESYISDEKEEKNLVLAVLPPRLNERLAVQKGQFIFPCNLRKSFEYNLCKTMMLPFDSLNSSNATQLTEQMDQILEMDINDTFIIKINLPASLHKEILVQLYRMNIDAASLFPGLDGFARSLKFFILNPDVQFRISSSPLDLDNENVP